MRKFTGVMLASVIGLFLVGAAIAGMNTNRTVHLTGDLELPANDSAGQGQAIFHLAKDGQSIDYKLIVANIDNVHMAHIHMGAPPGQPRINGGVGVWLFPSTTPGPGPTGQGRFDGPIATGTITAANLVGPFTGMTIEQLWNLIENGGAYVNVHTNDGIPPTGTGAGDLQAGEIRGDF